MLLRQEVTIDLIVVGDGHAGLVVGDVEIQGGVVDGLGQVSFLSGVEYFSGLMALLWLELLRMLLTRSQRIDHLLLTLGHRAEDFALAVLADVQVARLHVILLPTSHPAAYDADVLLHLQVRVLRLLHLLLQLHPVDQGLLELSARHQSAHVLEADRRLLGSSPSRAPRMLLRSQVMVHREAVHIFL